MTTRSGGRAASAALAVATAARIALRLGARPIASARELLDPDVRRALPGYWRRRVLLGGAVVVLWVAAVVVGARTGWWLTFVVLAPFAAEAVVLAWRRRPDWPTRAGAPRGNVGVGVDPLCRWGALAAGARRYGPVFASNYFADPMVAVADLAVATRLLRDHSADFRRRPLDYDRFVPGGLLRFASEPRRTELRRAFAGALSPRLVRAWTPETHRRARAVLAEAAGAAARSGSGVDPTPAVRELARAMCCAVLLGIAADDPRYLEARARMPDLEPGHAHRVTDEQVDAQYRWFTALVRERAARPAVDAPVSVAHELGAGPLADEGLARNLVFLAIGQREDVTGLLRWLCWYLATNPQWLEALRAPDAPADLADRIVSETLRLDQSEWISRQAVRDVVTPEFTVPSGWMLRACIREIHRDPARFADPERFDPDRFSDGAVGRDRYAPFGIDHHACIGEDLTRTIARVLAWELARGFDVEVTADGPRAMTVHGHWAPSPAFRIRLTARTTDRGVGDEGLEPPTSAV